MSFIVRTAGVVAIAGAALLGSTATAAAEPPELPPATRLRFQGLRAGPNHEVSVEEPMANSSMLVFPTNTVPVAANRSTTVAS